MRVARRAAEISGGAGPLARYLKVSPFLVAGWMDGRQDVPADTFLKLVDIAIGGTEAGLPGAIPEREAETFRHRDAANS